MHWITIINMVSQKLKRIAGFLYLKAKGVKVAWPGPRIDVLPRVIKARGSEISIGKDCVIFSGNIANPAGVIRKTTLVTLSPNAKIVIGNNVQASGALLCAVDQIAVNDFVMLGANVMIYDTDFHPVSFLERVGQKCVGEAKCAPVVLGYGCWIGANSTILKGSRIGAKAVVGACSVVVKCIGDEVVAAGNPCRPIRGLLKEKSQ